MSESVMTHIIARIRTDFPTKFGIPRSNNPQNVVTATMEGLKSMRSAAQVAAVRGKAVEEL